MDPLIRETERALTRLIGRGHLDDKNDILLAALAVLREKLREGE